ncbi:hypothetical protein FJ251_10455 [bacterium]|nr:hypothetical protein [bacterium]
MRNVVVLTLASLREALRDRLLYSLLGLGAVVLGVLALMAPLTLGGREKTFHDAALAWIHASALLTMLVLGAWTLHRERERGIWLSVLARPISRQEYLLGRLAGLLGTLGLVIGAATLIYLAIGWATRVPLLPGLGTALLYVFLEMSLLAGIVLLFSTFTGLVMTLFLALAVFAAGHLSADLLRFAALTESGFLRALALAAHWLLPHLELYRVRTSLVGGDLPAPGALLGALGYTLLYFLALVGAAAAIFARREIR